MRITITRVHGKEVPDRSAVWFYEVWIPNRSEKKRLPDLEAVMEYLTGEVYHLFD